MSLDNFAHPAYQDHNRARLGHLASLGLQLSNRRVLEVGSGPGDHTGFYIDRGCWVTAIDARPICLDALRARHPKVETYVMDMNRPDLSWGLFDVVHCYGLLYHLAEPSAAIQAMARSCGGILALETCVSIGNELATNPIAEGAHDPTQSSTGWGCRPTRAWVFSELQKCFPFVYQTRTQPNHPEFPLDWRAISPGHGLIRSVFVASRRPIDLPTLSPEVLDVQTLA